MRGLFVSTLAMILSTSVMSAQDANWKEVLEAKLRQRFPSTKTSTRILERGEAITAPGAVLVVNQDGIQADDGYGMLMRFARVKNGRITNAISGAAGERQRLMRPGDRLYVRDISVGDEKVDVRLFTSDVITYAADGSNHQRRFLVSVRFEFDKGVLHSASDEEIAKAMAPVLSTPAAFSSANRPTPATPATSVAPVIPPSRSAGRVDLRVGDPAPDFSFVDGKGTTYKLADYKGKAIVIVWFAPNIRHRGVGMLYQTSQCKGLRDARQYLEPLNVAYFMVSLSTPAENSAFVDEWCQGANFPILSDVEGRAAVAYDVVRTESGIDPSKVYGPGAGQVPRDAFVFASTTYIGPDGRILYMEDQNEIGQHLRGYGRDVAIRLQQLGVKTLAELSAPAPGPKTIELGQTIEQVEAVLGKPSAVANLGEKTVYTYPSMKVIFMRRKVTDVQ
jgi:peroxiredoxin